MVGKASVGLRVPGEALDRRESGGEHEAGGRVAENDEARFREMADGTPVMIWATDAEARIEFVNRAYCEFFDVTREQVRLNGWRPLLHPDDEVAYVAAFREAMRGRCAFRAVARVRRADGAWRWVESHGAPRLSAGGELLGMVGSSPDITDLVEAEEALRELAGELEQRVAARTAELRERVEQLARLASSLTATEERERRRLAQVLHDNLQQLLVAAKLQLSLLGRNSHTPDERQALLAVRGLVDEAYEVSQSVTTELSPPILTRGGLRDALEWLARWMQEKHGLQVDAEVAAEIDPVADEVKALLFETAREALLNVVKHAGVGHARLVAVVREDELTVTVSDSGVGFDPTALDSRERLVGGFGLLSARERLSLIGGRLIVRSGEHAGTMVAARVPREAPEPAAIGEAVVRDEPVEALRGPVVRVLLVDDHRVVRQGIASLLAEEVGIVVAGEAANGQEAIEAAERLRPDVILMDCSMPVMDGVEATRVIRAEQPAVRIIGLSMYQEPAVASAMRQAGAEAYLTKSGSPESLIEAIRGRA